MSNRIAELTVALILSERYAGVPPPAILPSRIQLLRARSFGARLAETKSSRDICGGNGSDRPDIGAGEARLPLIITAATSKIEV
jgi:hypothetical protein